MAVNQSRNQNDELGEGTTDGTYKKFPMNRSAVSNPDSNDSRDKLPWIYGLVDTTGINPTTGKPARRAESAHYRHWYE